MTAREGTTQARTQARRAAHDLLQARMLPITKLAERGGKDADARAESDAALKRPRRTQGAATAVDPTLDGQVNPSDAGPNWFLAAARPRRPGG